MNSVQTAATAPISPRHHRDEHDAIRPHRPPRRLGFYLVWGAILVALGIGAWIYRAPLATALVAATEKIRASTHGKPEAKAHRLDSSDKPTVKMLDGAIVLPASAAQAMSLATTPVLEQTKPIELELLGTTEYITDTVTQVRPMFKGRVDKVYVTVNQQVKVGDPLVDLYSKDLAEAKSVYEVERIQWVYDKNLLDNREKLIKSNAIAAILFEETRNNEMKSHKEYEVARNKLMVFGLTDADVAQVEREVGAQTARMTLRSRSDGFVIDRNVVPGNLYDENDTLLTIAPLDRLWVWGNVFESDLDLIRLGQSWEIRFPFLEDKVLGKVEYISNRVDPNTHAVRVRTSIPNLHDRLKSDMLVRGMLSIDAVPGRTVVPRTSLIVDGGQSFVFIRVPDHPDRFERRPIHVAQEKDDHVVVDQGLKAGEDVVSVGGLLLSQIYDDLKLVASGAAATATEDHAD